MFYYLRIVYVITVFISVALYFNEWRKSNKLQKSITNNMVFLFSCALAVLPVLNTLIFVIYLFTKSEKVQAVKVIYIKEEKALKNIGIKRYMEMYASRNIMILFMLSLPFAAVWMFSPGLISGIATILLTAMIITLSRYNKDCLPEVKSMLKNRGYELVDKDTSVICISNEESFKLVRYYPKRKSLVAQLEKE